MQTNVLWTGIEYYSLENCLVTTTVDGTEVDSVIVGKYHNKIYRVEYRIKTNPYWQTVFFEVTSKYNNNVDYFKMESDGMGNWMSNGLPNHQFEGCMDIDISLTPFSNTLPINRLKLAQQASQEIKVIYLNLLDSEMKPVRQKYKHTSATQYHYENIHNDFEAEITVDEQGLVVLYPTLFIRSAIIKKTVDSTNRD